MTNNKFSELLKDIRSAVDLLIDDFATYEQLLKDVQSNQSVVPPVPVIQRTALDDLPSYRIRPEEFKLFKVAAQKAGIDLSVWIKDRLLTAASKELSKV